MGKLEAKSMVSDAEWYEARARALVVDAVVALRVAKGESVAVRVRALKRACGKLEEAFAMVQSAGPWALGGPRDQRDRFGHPRLTHEAADELREDLMGQWVSAVAEWKESP